MALRFDLVFSYWIYIWYLFYIYRFISYSPKIAIGLGIIDNIIMLALMIYFGSNVKAIFYFILINTFIKVVPFYTLRNETIRLKDVYFTIILFIIFIIWLHINQQNLIGNIKLIHDSLLYNKNQTPFMSLLGKIESNFKQIALF